MRSILTICLLWLCQLAVMGQARIGADPDYNPTNPADPNVPVKKYTLVTKVVPDFSGSTNRSTKSQYSVGERVYINTSANTGYKFVNWTKNDSVLSTSKSFYYTMPEEDVVLNANFVYSPDSPADPDSMALSYELTVEAQPKFGGSFNVDYATVQQGSNTRLYSYTNTGYRFVGWFLKDSLLSTASSFYYTMGGEDAHIVGKFEYNPSNPSNPGKNFWDKTTGEVIVDDFVAGNLNNAINTVIGNSSSNDVTMITVSGRMNSNDFGIANNYSNCTYLDLSRSFGYSSIPSYAYDYNTALTNIVLPACVENIENRAFYQCSNLAEVVCYAITPPSVAGYAFTGIADGATLRVLSSSIPLYSEADVWKDFVILPLIDEVRTLEVALPAGSEDGRFKNMTLELLNIDNGQKQKYLISDRVSYTFSGLLKKSTFNVYVKNALGVVLGEITNVVIGEENVSVAFESLLEPQTVTAKIVTPDGRDVTAQSQLQWFMEDGTYLQTGSVLDGFVEGTNVILRTSLPQATAMQYVVPADYLYTIVSGNNTPTIVLKELPQVQLHGTVTDVVTGKALSDATVSVSQTLNGKYTKTFAAKSNRDGSFALTVFDAPGTISVVSTDYISKSMELPALSDSVNVGEIALKPITGAIIDLAFSYTKSVVDGETPDVIEYYSDYVNIAYTIYNETKNRAITQFNVQYPKIVLLEEVAEGDILRVTASSVKNAFTPVTCEAEVYSNSHASALFDIVQLGGIKAEFSSTDNSAVVAMLYNANGELMKKYDYSLGAITIPELQDGNYTLVTMGNSTLFNSVYNLSQIPATGLKEGTDYVKNSVSVSSGTITTINNEIVPLLDESKLYYTGSNTSFSVNKVSIVAGNYLTLKGLIDFKSAYASKVDEVNMVIDLPESASFVENSVMVGSNISGYTLDGNRLTIPLGKKYTEQVRFCIIPTTGGDFAPSAFAQFTIDGKDVLQPIGSVNYTVKDLSITVPPTIAKSTLPVNGTAIGGSTVRIYDGDILIGETTALANGVWATTGELGEIYNLSTHSIYAKVTTKQGLELQSEVKECFYDRNAVQVSSVTMINVAHPAGNLDLCEYVTVFDFLNPPKSIPAYWFWPSYPQFTFLVDFTNNDSTIIKDVRLNVFTNNGSVTSLYPVFDGKSQKWVTTAEFSSYNLPVNASVDFEINLQSKTELELEKQKQAEERVELCEHITDWADENIDIELYQQLDDADIYVLKDINTEDEFFIQFKELDYDAEIASMNDSLTYSVVDIDDGLFCVKTVVNDDNNRICIVDTSEELALELTVWTEKEDKDSVSSSPSYASKRNLLKGLISGLKKSWKNGSLINSSLEIGGGIIDGLGLMDYTEIPSFICTAELASSRLDNLENMLDRMAKESNRMCPDGKPSLDATDLKKLKDDISFYNGYLDDLESAYYWGIGTYATQVVGSVCYDVVTTLLGAKIAKGLAWGGKILKNSKNASYFKYNIPIKNTTKIKREILENGLGIAVGEVFGTLENFKKEGLKFDFKKTGEEFDRFMDEHYNFLQKQLASSLYGAMKKTRCPEKPKPSNPITPQAPYVMDPSGYVYEAVSSNRLEGVTATCYYKEMVEDMYGDLHENIVKWNAEDYAQENPVFTDKNGMYCWDVPQGLWQVKYEKEGYETTYSEWLPVPPPQLEVNVGMTQNKQPEVNSVKAYTDGVVIEFDKYMQPSSLDTNNIIVSQNDVNVEGRVELLDEEIAYADENVKYASRVRFVPASPFTAEEVTLFVSNKVKSYAGVQMSDCFQQALTVEKEVKEIVVSDTIIVSYGGEEIVTVTVLPAEASVGKILHAVSASDAIVSLEECDVLIGEDGTVQFVLNGALMGASAITFEVEGCDVKATSYVKVMEPGDLMVAMPTASLASGSSVYRGTTVSLSASSDEHKIWYTTDESCPCEEGGSRILYSEPIVIDDNVKIKAIAEDVNGEYSEIATFAYRIMQSTDGVALNEGWNWVSFNMKNKALENVNEALQSGTWSVGDEIKDNVYTDSYSETYGRWIGTMSNNSCINNTGMYMIHSSVDQHINLTGEAVNPRETAITVGAGWNYIAYLPMGSLSVAEALADYSAQEDDVIKSQDCFAIYSSENGWEGTLEQLYPREGYMLKRAESAAITTFNYPAVTIGNNRAANIRRHRYAHNMNLVVCATGVDLHIGDSIVAYSGNEVRGCGVVDSSDNLFLTVMGDERSDIKFSVLRDGEVIATSETKVTYEPNAVLGKIKKPKEIRFVREDGSGQYHIPYSIVDDEFVIYVNERGVHSFSLAIYNLNGMMVFECPEQNIEGSREMRFSLSDLSSGVYLVKVIVNDNSEIVKIVKK